MKNNNQSGLGRQHIIADSRRADNSFRCDYEQMLMTSEGCSQTAVDFSMGQMKFLGGQLRV